MGISPSCSNICNCFEKDKNVKDIEIIRQFRTKWIWSRSHDYVLYCALTEYAIPKAIMCIIKEHVFSNNDNSFYYIGNNIIHKEKYYHQNHQLLSKQLCWHWYKSQFTDSQPFNIIIPAVKHCHIHNQGLVNAFINGSSKVVSLPSLSKTKRRLIVNGCAVSTNLHVVQYPYTNYSAGESHIYLLIVDKQFSNINFVDKLVGTYQSNHDSKELRNLIIVRVNNNNAKCMQRYDQICRKYNITAIDVDLKCTESMYNTLIFAIKYYWFCSATKHQQKWFNVDVERTNKRSRIKHDNIKLNKSLLRKANNMKKTISYKYIKSLKIEKTNNSTHKNNNTNDNLCDNIGNCNKKRDKDTKKDNGDHKTDDEEIYDINKLKTKTVALNNIIDTNVDNSDCIDKIQQITSMQQQLISKQYALMSFDDRLTESALKTLHVSSESITKLSDITCNERHYDNGFSNTIDSTITRCPLTPLNKSTHESTNGENNPDNNGKGNNNNCSQNNRNNDAGNRRNNDDKNKKDENGDDEDKKDDDENNEEEQTICQNKLCSETIRQQQKLIQQQQQTIALLQHRDKQNHENYQKLQHWINVLRDSHMNLLTTFQMQHDMNQNKHYSKNKRKNKKKQIKSKQKHLFSDIQNDSSYEPSPYTRAKGNVYISQTMTQLIADKMGKDKTFWYRHMDKKVAMQFNDHVNDIDKNIIAIDLDLHDEKKQEKYYNVIETQNDQQSKTNNKYKMIDRLFTLKEIAKGITIHQSARLRLKSHLKSKELIEKLMQSAYEKMIDIKWFNITIFRKKDRMYNKQRIVLRLENEFMKKIMRNQQNIKKELIPIIMFNNSSHWIEWILIAKIIENVNIGISFKYDEYKNSLETSGIHVNKQLLLEQHYLASSPQHINECDCFSDNVWTSCITDIDICGDLNENDNKIKDYKLKYDSLKAFIYQFIHADDDQSLKPTACLLVDHHCHDRNGFSICSTSSNEYTMSTPTFSSLSTSPSLSASHSHHSNTFSINNRV